MIIFILFIVKNKIKIISPLFALIYLLVSGSSMLCASASIYFVNKDAKPIYASKLPSQSKQIPVWIIQRHIVNPSKVSVSSHIGESNVIFVLCNNSYVIIKEVATDLYLTDYSSLVQARAPPIV